MVKVMAQQIYGVIINYRIGPKTQQARECIISFAHVTSASEAGRLIGRKVAWKDDKNRIVGRIVALHGKKGVIRARFRRCVPSQALGSSVELIG